MMATMATLPKQLGSVVDIKQCQRLTVVIMAQTSDGQPLEMKITELTLGPSGDWPSLKDILEGKVAAT